MQPIKIIDYEDDVTEAQLIPVMSGGGANPMSIIVVRMGSIEAAALMLCDS